MEDLIEAEVGDSVRLRFRPGLEASSASEESEE